MWEEWEVYGAFFKVIFLSKDSRRKRFISQRFRNTLIEWQMNLLII